MENHPSQNRKQNSNFNVYICLKLFDFSQQPHLTCKIGKLPSAAYLEQESVWIHAGNPNWRGWPSTVDLLVLTSLYQLVFILKILFTFVTKQTSLMRRSTVLSFPLQLGFSGLWVHAYLSVTMTLSIMTFSITALSRTVKNLTPSILGLYTECLYTECHDILLFCWVPLFRMSLCWMSWHHGSTV